MTAVIDTFGRTMCASRSSSGVAKDRIETVIALAAPVELGVTAEGSHAAASTKALAEVASLVASERIEVPIAATYLWARVREAYDQLELRHTCGEIVLIP